MQQTQNQRFVPFSIHVPEGQLRDLHGRLRSARWPDEASGEEWQYGTSLRYLAELVAYWGEGFDWRRQEAMLNRIPQFSARIEDHTIHFIWQRSASSRGVPLLLTHGWPSTCFEVRRLLPMLVDPASNGADPADAFDVVAPSVPGYGFSSRPANGVDSRAVARLFDTLMTDVLGYSSYFAHGGDIGAGITSALAYLYPNRVRGIHLTAVREPFRDDRSRPLSNAETVFLQTREQWSDEEGGYSHLQRTRPQTIGFALNDSPVGLLAWITEKLRAWSDCGGDLERRFSKDDTLMTAMIYWVTETIGSSMRYYAVSRQKPWTLEREDRIGVPTAVALFPKDLSLPPREWAERTYNVMRWTAMPRGGHFAAHEEPILLAADIRAAFGSLR